ncbi:MAG: caspase family protein [Sulfuritalea sp.]
MITRRTFIKTLAAIPPALSFRRAWAANPSPDPSRLALIIGNAAYQGAPLDNPLNDAKAVGGLFAQAGFTVDSRLNATRADMMAAIERFGTAAKRSETKLVVFYYAGHGAQLDWRNYLLPVDAVVKKPEDMKQRCVDMSLLLGQLSAAKDKTFIIILDACRNNPFGTDFRPEHKGLSQFDAPVGSLLAYATSPGNVASDGSGANGLYTENLVRELSQRGTRIEDALKRVRLNVRLASHGEQIPWETTSLEGDVFIFDEGRKKLSETELEKLVEADVAEWARIKSSKKIDDWVAYLRNFPNGRFAEIAQMRLNRLLADVEKQRQEQERIAEEQRLAAERKRLEEQQREEQRRREEEQRQLEARRRQEEERLERERQRIAEAERQAAELRKKEELRQAAEQKRLSEKKRLDQERMEREQARLAAEQRLAAERKQLEEQQLQEKRRREDEQQRVELSRRQEQERLERERQRITEAERLAAARKQEEQQLTLARAAEVQAAAATPAPSAAAPGAVAAAARPPARASRPSAPMLDIRAGVPVPVLIAPSANPFSAGRYPLNRIFTVGDTATIVLTDILTGVEERTRTSRVTKVDYDEDRVEYNNGVVITDLMGNPIKLGPVEYDSPVQWTPAEFQVGKKWTAAFRLTRGDKSSNAYYDMQIVKRETISVPAGSFDTFRIEGEGWNTTRGLRLDLKLWLVPGVNFAIKREYITRNRRGGIGQSERQELVALRQRAIQIACLEPGSALASTAIKPVCAA